MKYKITKIVSNRPNLVEYTRLYMWKEMAESIAKNNMINDIMLRVTEEQQEQGDMLFLGLAIEMIPITIEPKIYYTPDIRIFPTQKEKFWKRVCLAFRYIVRGV